MSNCYRCKTCGTINVENNPNDNLNEIDKELLNYLKTYSVITSKDKKLELTKQKSLEKLFRLDLVKPIDFGHGAKRWFLASDKELIKKHDEPRKIKAKKLAKAKERLGKGRIVLDSETGKYINVDKITLDFAIKYNRNYRSATIKKIGADKYFIEDIDGQHSFESSKQIIKELRQYLLDSD